MILLVVGVVFLSGCAGEGGVGAPSIKISNFGPLTVGASTDRPIRNGKSITLSAMFKNEGGAKVTGGEAKIVGLGTDWVFTNPSDRKHNFDIEIGREVRKIWKVTAPITSNYELHMTYPVEVRYTFPYGTGFRAIFSWMSDDSYNTLLDSADQTLIEETLNSKGLTIEKSSLGPISIDLEEVEIVGNPEVWLKITNEGNGHLESNKLTDVQLSGISCPGVTGNVTGNEITLIDDEFEDYCTVTIGSDEDIPANIQITVKYIYYVSEKSNIYYHDIGK